MAVTIPAGVTIDTIQTHDDGPRYMNRPDGQAIRRPECGGYTVTVWVDTRYMDDPLAPWQEVAIKAATLAIADPLAYYPTTLYGWADWRLKVVGRPQVIYRDADPNGSGHEIIGADVTLRFVFDPLGAENRDKEDAERMRY